MNESTNDSFNSNNSHTIIQAIVITTPYCADKLADTFIMKIENCGAHSVKPVK